ncbi:MAG: ABC transporter permease [Pirellulales bacterium]
MIIFIFKRLAWMVLTLWVVFTVSFFLMRSVPGGPFDGERDLPPEIEANLLRRYHLDEPLWKQYGRELWNVTRFDLGFPFTLGEVSVNQMVRQGFPISAALGLMALTFAILVGLTAGILAAVTRGAWTDSALMAVATIGITLPNFVVAGILILLFAFTFPLFPAAGWGTIGHLALPAFCLGAPYAAEVARITRTSMLDVLSQDHIRTAEAKGLPKWRVITRHALPTALLPVVSFLGPAAAGILTGSIVIESVFAVPGIGSHFVKAAEVRDYTVAMGLVLLYTVILYTFNFIVDLAYAVLDPRVEWK